MSPFPNRNFGDAIAVQNLREIYILYISVQNFVRYLTPEPKSWRRYCALQPLYNKERVYIVHFQFVTTNFSISTDFSITLFGFLSSLALNNRIENLTLMIKFRGGALFSGGPKAVPLLPQAQRPQLAGGAWAPSLFVFYNKSIDSLILIDKILLLYYITFICHWPPNLILHDTLMGQQSLLREQH